MYPRPSFDGVTPSPRMNAADRTWSATTRTSRSAAALPSTARAAAVTGANTSVSYTDSRPCSTIAIRSSPEPVSTLANRSGSSSPDARCWYSMNTPAFQISMYRPAVSNSPPGWYAGPFPGPVSKNTSVHGPHGPVSPAVQKLSSPSQTM